MGGPTEEGYPTGVPFPFSGPAEGLLSGVRVEDGVAIVDLNDHVGGLSGHRENADRLLAGLDATVFQFPEIRSAVYRLEGRPKRFCALLRLPAGCSTRSRTNDSGQPAAAYGRYGERLPVESWQRFRSVDHDFSVRYPPGWDRAAENLTPLLVGPVEILTVSTGPLLTGFGDCGPVPGQALHVLQRDGALVTIQSAGRADAGDFPERPARFRFDDASLGDEVQRVCDRRFHQRMVLVQRGGSRLLRPRRRGTGCHPGHPQCGLARVG